MSAIRRAHGASAAEVRAEQFAHLDQQMLVLRMKITALRQRCGSLGPDDWTYTGLGSDLASLEAALRDAIGDEGIGTPCPVCDQASFVDESDGCLHCGAPREIR